VAVEGTRILRHGMSGDDVRFFQALLNIIACKSGFARLDEDGVFGDATLRAVSVFQRKKRLVVDGKVGPMTLGAVVAEVEAVTKAKR
jgi:peptidoglycan hydrolase-like protein with peptidoglycan-binding domain